MKPENWEQTQKYISKKLSRTKLISDQGELDTSGLIGSNCTIADLAYALTHRDEFGEALDRVKSLSIEIKADYEGFSEELTNYRDLCSDSLPITSIEVNSLEVIVDHLNIAQSNDLLQNIKSIQCTEKYDKMTFLELIKTINSHDCHPQSIHLSLVSDTDHITLKYLTNIDVTESYKTFDNVLEKLFNNFYSAIKDQENLTIEDIERHAKISAEQTHASDNHSIPYGRALRLLSQFDWDFLKLDIVKEHIKTIRAEAPTISDIYHLEEPDLHFYMVRVNDHNADLWREYAKAEESVYGNNRAKSKASIGVVGFIPSLRYYDNDATETWVAFVSNRELANPSIPVTGSIEMCVTMMTSEHAPFTSHVGIFRSPSYSGEDHKNLAMQLHSFIAKATLEEHPNKYYMINTPAQHMTGIIIDALEKHFGDSREHIFFGNGNNTYPTETIDQLEANHASLKNAGYYTTDRMIESVYKCVKNLNLAKQKEALESGKLVQPIHASSEEDYRSCSYFQIKDQENNVLCDLSEQDIHGEFSWFFDSPYLYRGQSCDTMITVRLDELGGLYNFTGDMEHYT